MGSLSPSGLRIVQQDVRFRHYGKNISLTSITGVPQDDTIQAPSISTNREKFAVASSSSGNLEHDVTRKISGIHVSISHREAILQQNKTAVQIASGVLGGNALGPMETVTERKVFFLDSDRGKSSGFADYQIFSASGIPITAADGVTDTDITPNATFDQ